MVRVVQSKVPIVFEEQDGSLPVSEGGLFLVPSEGCVVAWCTGRRLRRMGADAGRDQGSDLGIEGRNPPKAAALPARFGGKFPCNQR